LTGTPYRYERAGFLIESDWPLPGLNEPHGVTAPIGRLRIRRDTVPKILPEGVFIDAMTQAARGCLLFHHRGVGRFLAYEGREIIVDPAGDDLGYLLPFVLGSGFAAICIQSGLVLLHASAVAIGDNAVAFAGPSGAGKSTLLAACVAAGLRPLADDVSLIEPVPKQPARIWATPGYLRLWPDSVQALGLVEKSVGPELAGSAKLQLALDVTSAYGPRPLSAVCLLIGDEADDPAIEPMENAAAMAGVVRQLFRAHYVQPLGQLGVLVPKIAEIVAGTRIFRMNRPVLYDRLPATVAMVRCTIESAG